MQPKSQERDAFELFQAHFDQLLNPAHELLQRGAKMDWGGGGGLTFAEAMSISSLGG